MKEYKNENKTKKRYFQSENRAFNIIRRKGIIIEKGESINTSSTHTKNNNVFRN